MDKQTFLKQLAVELHKPVKTKFLRRKVSFQYIDQVWCADLVDLSVYSKENKGYKWMMNMIDGFSRFAFSKPMRDKSAKSTFDAFAAIVKRSGRSPERIWCDQGAEFVNSTFKKAGYSPDKGTMYFVHNEGKSVIVERFNRTLKEMAWRRSTELQTEDWVEMLPELVDEYNNRKHSTLGMSPAEASKEENVEKVEPRVNHVVAEPP